MQMQGEPKVVGESSEEIGSCTGIRIYWNKNLEASDPVGTTLSFYKRKTRRYPV